MKTSDLVEKKSWNWGDGSVERVLCCASEFHCPAPGENTCHTCVHLSRWQGVGVEWKWRQKDCWAGCQCSITFSERLSQEDKERVVEQGQLRSSFVTHAHLQAGHLMFSCHKCTPAYRDTDTHTHSHIDTFATQCVTGFLSVLAIDFCVWLFYLARYLDAHLWFWFLFCPHS